MVSGDGLLRGKPRGGVGVVWGKAFAHDTKVMYYYEQRIM